MLTDEQRAEGWIEHDGGEDRPTDTPFVSIIYDADGRTMTGKHVQTAIVTLLLGWRDVIAYKPEHPHD